MISLIYMKLYLDFLTSLIVTVVVSKFTKKPQIDVEADLTDVRRLVKTGED